MDKKLLGRLKSALKNAELGMKSKRSRQRHRDNVDVLAAQVELGFYKAKRYEELYRILNEKFQKNLVDMRLLEADWYKALAEIDRLKAKPIALKTESDRHIPPVSCWSDMPGFGA